jgi:hypothetical protein
MFILNYFLIWMIYFNEDINNKDKEVDISIELVEKIVKWDKKNKRLDAFKFKFMVEILEGKRELSDKNKYLVRLNLKTAQKYGFVIN